MPTSLLSLPPELLTQIALLVLGSPCHNEIHVSPPRSRFTYEDGPPPAQLVNTDYPSTSPRRTPPARPSSTLGLSTPSSSTRSCTLETLPRRPFNPHLVHTTISLLLVCQYLRAVATPIYYSHRTWAIGNQARSPTIATFRDFLTAIGPSARSHIQSIMVVSSHGYGCFWLGPPTGWIPQLKRCGRIQSVQIRMSWAWRAAIDRRDGAWRQKCVDAWRNTGLQEVKHVAPCGDIRPTQQLYPGRLWNSKVEGILDKAFGQEF